MQVAIAVLRDNLFGLEIDPRCTQIAAFALALAASKAGGYRQLPILNIACSGIAVTGQLETWTKLAGDDVNLRMTLERHYHLFRNAPDLGSLINPNDVPLQDRMFTAEYTWVEPLLIQALAKERNRNDPASTVFGTMAAGVARAAKLMADKYTLVTTNVPYLGRIKQADILYNFCALHYPEAKAELATVFVHRCLTFCCPNGTIALVTPQNWLFLSSHKEFRQNLLKSEEWNLLAKLGEGAFQSPLGVSPILIILTHLYPIENHDFQIVDTSSCDTINQKKFLLRSMFSQDINQKGQLGNPDARVSSNQVNIKSLLSDFTISSMGMSPGDRPRFYRYFWEPKTLDCNCELSQTSVSETIAYVAMSQVIFYQKAQGELYRLAQSLKHLNHAVQNWQRG